MGNIRGDGGLEMGGSEFKIVWGSPLASEAPFDSARIVSGRCPISRR